LPKDLPQACYWFLAKKHLPESVNSLSSDDCFGGCLATDDEWCCFYRFFNGGYDLRGRPDRFVLLCAFVERSVINGCDCSGLLDSEPFLDWAGKQPLQGTPFAPKNLEQEFVCERLNSTPAQMKAPSNAPAIFSGAMAVSESWSLCSRLPVSDSFHWRVNRLAGKSYVELQTLTPFGSGTQTVDQAALQPRSNGSGSKITPSIPPVAPKQPRNAMQRISLMKPSITFLVGIIVGLLVGASGVVSLGKLFSNWTGVPSSPQETVSKDDLRGWLQNEGTKKLGELNVEQIMWRLENNDWTSSNNKDQPRQPGGLFDKVRSRLPTVPQPLGSPVDSHGSRSTPIDNFPQGVPSTPPQPNGRYQ
jgi:hypothetical protein